MSLYIRNGSRYTRASQAKIQAKMLQRGRVLVRAPHLQRMLAGLYQASVCPAGYQCERPTDMTEEQCAACWVRALD